jgi:DNA-binding winged helix-turn-helix (wHTH) protein
MQNTGAKQQTARQATMGVNMRPLDSSRKRVRFGDFDADLRSSELRKRGIRIKLQAQPFHVLQILLERRGEVVTREELQNSVWPAETFVDFDQGLNNAVKRLREALGDDAERPRFIETLAKRGYRFIGSIQDERNDFFDIGETEAPADEFAGSRADATDMGQAPAGSRQVEVSRSNQKGRAPAGGFAWGVATGILFSAFAAAAFLLHSYPGQIGEVLIQLGQRLEAKPAMQVMMSAAAPVPALVNPEQPAAPTIRAPIPFSPLQKPYGPGIAAAAEPYPELAGAEVSLTPVPISLPISTVADDLDLPSLVERIELRQPEIASQSARDNRDPMPPYPNSSAGKYLDVGKFGNGLRANQVMDELGQLGYDGVIVHNRSLWKNSYHILVGPYTNEGELVAARPGLESRGFSPQVLRSKSTRVSLPPMTIYGTDLTIKDCIVSWDLNSPEATVKFIKGRKVIATVRGKWEKREFVPKWNAIISLVKERGPETLVEIQWHDTDKVLVLDGEAFRFYPTSLM